MAEFLDRIITKDLERMVTDVTPITGTDSIKIVDVDYLVTNLDYTILIDCSSNTVTVTLPASPSTGKIYNLKCIEDNFTCTINRNGNNIGGDASNIE